jgi:hypothetical protein
MCNCCRCTLVEEEKPLTHLKSNESFFIPHYYLYRTDPFPGKKEAESQLQLITRPRSPIACERSRN